MFARKLKIMSDKWGEIGTTPMMVPSFSSRSNIKIKETIYFLRDCDYTGPILVSAYDVKYTKKFPNMNFSDLIFLDSGGYEVARDKDVSEIGLYKPDPHEWNRDLHKASIKKLSTSKPMILISYDHPLERHTIKEQISEAVLLFKRRKKFSKEILLKSERDKHTIDIDHVIENVESLDQFDIIGMTEKELGSSVLERMLNIAKLRIGMNDSGVIKPIHLFGSLDPITTPLYFFSGADIFDGLSWLRFIFENGNTLYIDSYGPRKYGIQERLEKIWKISMSTNNSMFARLKLDLEKFQLTNDFRIFGDHADFFKDSYEDFESQLRRG
jgi:hypothetical protein